MAHGRGRIGRGSRLNRNYFGMRDTGVAPKVTRIAATSYAFSIKLKVSSNPKAAETQTLETLCLVWRDYPDD